MAGLEEGEDLLRRELVIEQVRQAVLLGLDDSDRRLQQRSTLLDLVLVDSEDEEVLALTRLGDETAMVVVILLLDFGSLQLSVEVSLQVILSFRCFTLLVEDLEVEVKQVSCRLVSGDLSSLGLIFESIFRVLLFREDLLLGGLGGFTVTVEGALLL